MQHDITPALIAEEAFRRLEQPMQDERALEQQLLQNGCLDAVSLWGQTILEGFTRFRLCLKHGVPVRTHQVPVHNQREALGWACAAQLRRDDLSREMRIYLIGKRYNAEKGVPGRRSPQRSELPGSPDVPKSCKTASQLGAEYGLGRAAVTQYSIYARAIDRLFETAPGFAGLILSGALALSQKNVICLAQLSEETLLRAEQDPQGFVQQLRTHQFRLPAVQRPASSMLVKQMPSYDPDAELSGLTLTIPSWVSSIQRTHSTAAFSAASSHALEELAGQLLSLTQSAEQLMRTIKEVL